MKTYHEEFAGSLLGRGIETVFGLVGDANLFLMDSFSRLGGRYVSLVHEANVVAAALGFASVSGEVGVASVTQGPGLTNTITALIEGVRARLPVVLFAGKAPASDPQNLQHAPQAELVTAAGAACLDVEHPDDTGIVLDKAFRTAMAERRPVVVNVPNEFQWLEVEPWAEPEATKLGRVGPDPDEIRRVVDLIESSERPLILAGRGAGLYRDVLVRLADRLSAPLATTVRGMGLFSGHPFDLGLFGGLASPVAREIILESDCLLSFGASLNQWTAAGGELLAGRRVIRIDTDPLMLTANVLADVAVHADAGLAAESILRELDERGVPAKGFAGAEMASRLATESSESGEALRRLRSREEARAAKKGRAPGTVHLSLAMAAIDRAFAEERILVIESGRHTALALPSFHVSRTAQFVYAVNFGSIGFGLGYAIGASCASPGTPVLLVCGDGGFMLGSLSEMSSAVRAKCPIAIALLNDGSYGAEHIQMVRRGLDPSLTLFEWPSFAEVASLFGFEGHVVGELPELDEAAALLTRWAADRPLMLDIRLDPAEISAESLLS